jgi:hypothetical protein
VFGERADPLAGARPGVAGSCEVADVVEGEPCALGDVDDRQAVQHVLAVAAPAAGAFGCGQDADAFVVADVRGLDAGAGGDLTDAHRVVHGCP